MCSVYVAGGQTEWFSVSQDVHQGAPFSMKLYMIFNNDLLETLAENNIGTYLRIPGINVTCPAYADDISLVALYKSSLQAMLDEVYDHSRLWRYEYNADKTKILVFNSDNNTQSSCI